MPSSCFYKLRSKRNPRRSHTTTTTSSPTSKPRGRPTMAPIQPPYSPNRASYYFPSRDRPDNDKFRPRPATKNDDIVFEVSVVGRRTDQFNDLDVLRAMPELKLRPILTRPIKNGSSTPDSSSTASAATSPATRVRRFHVRPSCRRRGGDRNAKAAALHPAESRRQRRWLYESLVVVRASADPGQDFAESMAEMIVENDVRSSDDLEELLACYLALNAAEHHRAIVGAFRRVWFVLARQRLQQH